MNFVTHPIAQGAVDELVTRDAALPGELRGHDPGMEVSMVIGFDVYVCTGETGADELGHLFGIHGLDLNV
jgi:hypothetical protein